MARSQVPLHCILKWSAPILLFIYSLKLYQHNPHDKDLKYVLLWSPRWNKPAVSLEFGQKKLNEMKCPDKNCYFTDDRDFFGGDLKNFDVLVFNGMSREVWFEKDLPKQRYPYQKYVFMNMESADRFPICSPTYDNFFNWTLTYKLDSDCAMPYFTVHDKHGNKVGPNMDMDWIEPMNNNLSEYLMKKVKKRNKIGAWFVSNCHEERSGRVDVVQKLQIELEKFNVHIDIYGDCGKLKCKKCGKMLENEYLFYMAFENSLSEDYVTEKLFRTMHRKVVPVVLGGANYNRFLPPGSYLDARTSSPQELASTMIQMITNPKLYSSFLSWTNHYEYRGNGLDRSICDFCELINNKKKFEQFSLYEDFRSWWNPDFRRRCEDMAEDPKYFFSLPLLLFAA